MKFWYIAIAKSQSHACIFQRPMKCIKASLDKTSFRHLFLYSRNSKLGYVKIEDAIDIYQSSPLQSINGSSERRLPLKWLFHILGILGPGLEKLGYVKIGDAIGKCTGDAMTKVEEEIERYWCDTQNYFLCPQLTPWS